MKLYVPAIAMATTSTSTTRTRRRCSALSAGALNTGTRKCATKRPPPTMLRMVARYFEVSSEEWEVTAVELNAD